MEFDFKGNCTWDQDQVYPASVPENLGDWLPADPREVRDESVDWLNDISLQDLQLEAPSETSQSVDSGLGGGEVSMFSEQRATFGFSDCSFASPRTDLWEPATDETTSFLYQTSEEGDGGDIVDDMSMDCIDANMCLQPSELDLLLNLDVLAVPESVPEPFFGYPTPPASLPIVLQPSLHQLDFDGSMVYQYQPLVPGHFQPDYPALLPVESVMELPSSCNYKMAARNTSAPLPPFSSLPKPFLGKRKSPTAKTKGLSVGVGGGKGKRITFKMRNKTADDAQLAQEVQQVLLPTHLKPVGWKHCQH